jgi:hypothetical protein
MVNGRLRTSRREIGTFNERQPPANRFERNFATNAALTSQIIGISTARSRFGPADSWVIKTVRAAASAVGH